ncbi:IS110 family transposase [Shewanella xiamenensis]|uniref:IS110 family transposase n=1 Tax=Shewanella TaxID=22 RepID=UPI00217DAF5E|nr:MULTISPECIES: IS110 family transposase [Shewanella]MCT8860486.1 IS110 family transposase [Shewanella xiamenensis]MDN5500089.1 IS110 family transposase [Shewanella sp.]MDN5530017.1 IS110 family transposase [Shewanella sp.]UWG64129.1 IS110 family transposase [Shewanella xiamenensis]
MNYKLISIDLAKTVFQVAAFNHDNTIAFNRKINRSALLNTLRQCEPTLVVMEACYSANYWGRTIEKLGHTVKLIPARMVKAMLVGNKNDANDAVAIGETASRPKVSLLRPKTVEQQDIQSLLRIRERLVENRTANCNQLRGFLAEYGLIIAKTRRQLMLAIPLILEDADNELSTVARGFIQRLYEFQLYLNEQIDQVAQDILALAQAMPLYSLLLTIPGVGPIVASTLLASINEVNDFKNGRQLAAWLGLTPSQYSSGTTNRLGKITKRGNQTLRRLLIHGARTVVNWCDKKDDSLSLWLQRLKQRQHVCKVTVALANKMARMVFVVMSRGQAFNMDKACKMAA